MKINVLLILVVVLLLDINVAASKEVTIDMHKIMMIESSGRNVASNIKSEHAIGIFQITPICLKEFNDFHPEAGISMDDLWNASICAHIAYWYINKRIPQLLRYHNKPVTVKNIIIAYNAGISYVVHSKPLPKITKKYLRKYFR